MLGKTLPAHELAGMDTLARACDESPQLRALGEPMTDDELHQRAELVAKVIETRGKLRMLRGKVEELQFALQRFCNQREAGRT